MPTDLAGERVLLDKGPNALDKNAQNMSLPYLGPMNKPKEASANKAADPAKTSELTDRDLAIAQLGKPSISEESLAERVGQLSVQVNLDYSVVERFSRETLQYTLLPFNLGKVLASPKSQDDLVLEAGDVITVFSNKDIQIPASKYKAFVRVEGEVNNPGVYPVEVGWR